jgi:hypothetical protein
MLYMLQRAALAAVAAMEVSSLEERLARDALRHQQRHEADHGGAPVEDLRGRREGAVALVTSVLHHGDEGGHRHQHHERNDGPGLARQLGEHGLV